MYKHLQFRKCLFPLTIFILVLSLLLSSCGAVEEWLEEAEEELKEQQHGGQSIDEDWVSHRKGPDDPIHTSVSSSSQVYPRPLAVDGSGNVYFTGNCNGLGGATQDFVTNKFDTSGNQIWTTRYDGGGDDYPWALAIDNWGNTYVTGFSQGTGGYLDYATIKYDSKGNELWVARYDGGGQRKGWARAIALDSSGNVYVTGRTERLSGGQDSHYTTIKYDNEGNELWVANSHDGAIEESAVALAVDDNGNVYTTGFSRKSVKEDIVTIKYDRQGKELWVARYDGDGDGCGKAVIVDHGGNVYVAGSSEDAETGSDYVIIKYDSQGNQLWVARYDGPVVTPYPEDLDADVVRDMAIDNSGNVYVTGSSADESGSNHITTIKYDSDGNQLWVARYKSGVGYAITLDDAGNAYVAGCWPGMSSHVVIKYDGNGNQVCVERHEGSGAWDIAIDGSNNIYVVGFAYIDGAYKYAIVKYTQKQTD